MAITRVAHGTVATGVNPVPGEPAGIVSGDILLCIARTEGNPGSAIAPTMSGVWTTAGSIDGSGGSSGVLLFGRLFSFAYTGTSPDYTVTANAASNGWAVVVAYRPSTGGVISVDLVAGHATTIAPSATVNYDTLAPTGANEMRLWAWFISSVATNGSITGSDPTPTAQLDSAGGYADGFLNATTATGARTSTLSISVANAGMTVLLLEVVTQDIPPTADVTDGNWLNESGSNVDLYASVDESVASDTDWIQSGDRPDSGVCELLLGSAGIPDTGTVTVTVRAKLTEAGNRLPMMIEPAAELRVDLVETSTIRATRYLLYGAGEETQAFDLTSGERAAITGWSDLRIRLTATTTSGRVRVTWLKLTTPANTATGTTIAAGFYRRRWMWEMAA